MSDKVSIGLTPEINNKIMYTNVFNSLKDKYSSDYLDKIKA